MPSYSYICKECEHEFNVTKKISLYNTPESCPECNASDCNKQVGMPQVMFKGDSWIDKNNRISKQMADKNKKLAVRENEMKRDAPSVKLVPNVDGERVDSWSDAQKLAKDKGKNTESYNELVKKEDTLKKS